MHCFSKVVKSETSNLLAIVKWMYFIQKISTVFDPIQRTVFDNIVTHTIYPFSNHGLENEFSGNISFAMPEPIRRERKNRSGSVLASMNPRTMSMKKKEEDNHVERIEVPYLCPIVLRKEVIFKLYWILCSSTCWFFAIITFNKIVNPWWCLCDIKMLSLGYYKIIGKIRKSEK